MGSVNKKGFKIENLERNKTRIKTSINYTIYVTKEKYEKLKQIIEKFKKNKFSFKYTAFGVILSVLGIPLKFKKKYFCSQFVSEILKESDVLKLKKKACLYHPNKLENEIRNRIPFNEMVVDYHLLINA